MNSFDEFIIGNIESIEWSFELTHFNQRLVENKISLNYIKHLIYEEDFIRYDQDPNNKYSVYYPAPASKEYDEIKIVFKCYEDKIDLITVMPITDKFKDKKISEIKKKRDKAQSSANKRFRYL